MANPVSQEYQNIIVFDIETIGNIASPNFVEEMQITVVGAYHYDTDEYKVYFEQDLPELEKRLLEADLLVGFNNDHFDTPILNKYYKLDLWSIASFDILKEFRSITGRRVGLNSIAGATLGMYKSGSGADAMTLFTDGKLDELAEYCLDDVKLTKEVFEHGILQKHLNYTSKDGWLRLKIPFEFNLDTFIPENTTKSQSAFI